MSESLFREWNTHGYKIEIQYEVDRRRWKCSDDLFARREVKICGERCVDVMNRKRDIRLGIESLLIFVIDYSDLRYIWNNRYKETGICLPFAL